MSDTPAAPETTPVVTTPVVEKPLEPQPKVYDEAYVQSLRQEAAGHRVGKNEAVAAAEKALKDAHAQELAARDTAYTELQNELGNAWIELQKVYTAVEAKVPSDKVRAFTEILKGNDEASITESAKSGLALFGGFETSKSPAFDPTQGFGGRKTTPLNGDPILEALKGVIGIK